MRVRTRVSSALPLLAVLAGTGPGAGATPTEPGEPARRVARVEAPFVPAGELDEVPGFTMKMRGERIAYCRFERKLGTRIRTETCIDAGRMPAYLAALEANREMARSLRTGENQIF